MISAVDTNVLLDVLIPNARFARSSQRQLDEAVSEGALVICEVVYAELAAQFPSQDAQDAFLSATRIRLEPSRPDALQAAARAWNRYLEQRGRGVQCPRCGGKQAVVCPECEQAITARQHILSDFMIGGHARRQADRLLTRDLGYYRTYFPDLTLIDT